VATTMDKLIIVLKKFYEKRVLTAYDEDLLNSLELEPKQVGRILDELAVSLDGIVQEKAGKKKAYRLVTKLDIFEKLFFSAEKLSWIYEMADEDISEAISLLTHISKVKDDIYRFKNTPYEDIKSLEDKDIFNSLKTAVKYKEYRDIHFYDGMVYKDTKCLKLFFMEGNWYIAFETSQKELKFGRISFIKSVCYSKDLISFSKNSVKKKLSFLDNDVQNPFTLYENEPKVALIKANPKISKYFKKGMKKFLDTQEFLEELDDESVLFTVKYTQDMEILPFIQKWMPDLVIIKPKELALSYKKKLESALVFYKDLS